nr:sigmaA core clamp protein [Avian orthoreovirus]
MARAVYEFFSVPFGNRGLATNRHQLSSLLTSSSSPWQRLISSLTPTSSPFTISTREMPFPGSALYQEAMLFSALVPGAIVGPDTWRDFNSFGFAWSDASLTNLVNARHPPPAPPYQPVSAQWTDLTAYGRWAMRPRDLQVKFPSLLRASLLSAMRAGPVVWVETWPDMCAGTMNNWLMSQYGNSFTDIVSRMVQSSYNMPFALDGSYDQQMRCILALWMLSYLGIINQTRTLGGFYFSSRTRGLSTDNWTLFYATNTARVNPTQRHFAYVCARSPDWNAERSWIAAATLTSIIMSCRQPPIFANQGVINAAQNHPNFSAAVGSPVYELNLLNAAQECIRALVLAGLIDAQKGQQMTQQANDHSQQLQNELAAIKAQDDMLYNQQPDYARRIKPFVNGDWAPGMTAQALAFLATFTN